MNEAPPLDGRVEADPQVYAELERTYVEGRLCVRGAMDYPEAFVALHRFVGHRRVDALAFYQCTLPLSWLATLLASDSLSALHTLVLEESLERRVPLTDLFVGNGPMSLRTLHLIWVSREALPSVAALLAIPALSGLETLELGWSDEPASDLFTTEKMARELIVRGLDDGQVAALTRAPYFSDLTRLDVGDSLMRPHGVYTLLTALRDVRLQHLVLGGLEGWTRAGAPSEELDDDRAELALIAGDIVPEGIEIVENDRSAWHVWPRRENEERAWRDGWSRS